MPERYELGWAAWQTSAGTYARSYVYPSAWSVTVDGCGSLGHGQQLTGFEIAVEGVGFDYSSSRNGGCKQSFTNLPRLGEFDVTLTVRTAGGFTDEASERIILRDYLIVSLGDSMASGEGSPDTPGRYELLNDLSTTADQLRFLGYLALGHPRPASDPDFKVREEVPVIWRDKRCHRSGRAGHALTAQAIESASQHSSVTFLSLACSGAEIKHLIDATYSGQQPPDNPQPKELRPQLAVLRDLLRPVSSVASRPAGLVQPGAFAGRRIDALLMSIGINDLDFSDIVIACATNPVPGGTEECVSNTGVTGKINGLAAKYDALAKALRGLNVAETYITDYPAAPFGRDEGGCGILGLRLVGISGREAAEMFSTGETFNNRIRDAANKAGWNFAEGMTQAFLGHDYCDDQRYLVKLEQSIDGQGTEHGAVHPNPTGHKALAAILGRAVALDRPAYPFIRAKVFIEQVKMGKSFRDRLDDYRVTVHRSAQESVQFRRGVGYMGRWVNSGLEFTIDVYDPPRPPRFATKLRFEVRPVNACCKFILVSHDARDTWGVGTHEVATAPTDGYPEGFLRIRYRVVAERIKDPNAPQQPVFTE